MAYTIYLKGKSLYYKSIKTINMYKQIKSIEQKIARLNDKIDNKIINGLSYKKEATEHMNLVAYLRDLKRVA